MDHQFFRVSLLMLARSSRAIFLIRCYRLPEVDAETGNDVI